MFRRLWKPRSTHQTVVQVRHPARTLALLFLILIFVGGVLLRLPISARAEPIDWSTAYFTATSAACVTGLAVVDTAKAYSPFGQAVILLLIQVGGLGYMLSATLLFLLFRREPALHDRLLLREALGEVTLRDTGRLVGRAVLFTFVVEGVGAVILTARFLMEPGRSFGDALWRGVFHSVSAFCNAGFDLFGNDAHGLASLAAYRDDWLVNFTVAALIIIGGLGFTVCYELAHRRSLWFRARREHRPISLHTRVVLSMTFWLILIGTVGVLVSEWSNQQTLGHLDTPHKFLAAFFQSVSLRTAGFSSVDFNHLRSITLFLGGIWMFIGASPGGTGGGVKTTTFAATLAAVLATLRNHPDAEVFDRVLPMEIVYRSIVLIFLSLTVVITALFILTFTEPTALQQAGIKDNIFMRLLFEVISAFATVGLSTGITAALSDIGRGVIMALMFLGRLGPTTAAAILAAPGAPPKRRLPEEKVALG